MNREEKMKIVINNYFKKECSVNTSIREAFEKGFRIGASKVQKKRGKWMPIEDSDCWRGYICNKCGRGVNQKENYCPSCGEIMGDGDDSITQCF